MQYLNLLAFNQNSLDLISFATRFFSALDIPQYEQRESSNFPDGYYVKATSGDLHFVVSSSDEATNEDLPYWIQVSGDFQNPDELRDKVDQIVREKLLRLFQIAVILNYGKQGEMRIDYK